MYRKTAILILALIISVNVAAQKRQIDAGVILGEPTGLSFKVWDKRFSTITAVTDGRNNAAKVRKVFNAGHSIISELDIQNDDVDDIFRSVNTNFSAFAGAIAWSFSDEGAFQVHLDYLRHRFDLFTVKEGELLLYYGLGGRIKTEKNDTRAGIRFPVGLDYLIPETEIDLFFEIVPIMNLVPKTEFNMNAAIGLRYAIGFIGRDW
ncbi:hypothetical protein ACFL6L_00030 [candidate division KSB1 bacterium]